MKADGATVWSSTQAVHPLKNTMATMLGLKPESVRIVFRMGPGCYGVNGADTVSQMAALLSQAVGRPVRVQLSRQDEMAWENYGPAYVIDQRVGLDASGTITCWDYEGWSLSRGGRPGGNAPGNVVTGMLAGFQPAGVQPRSPAPRPMSTTTATTPCRRTPPAPSATRQAARARFAASVCFHTSSNRRSSPGRSARPLACRTRSRTSRSWTRLRRPSKPIPSSIVSGISRSAAARRAECGGQEGRLGHAAVASREYPALGCRQRSRRRLRALRGDNGYCAVVAEVEVNQDSGLVVVRRCVVGMDCGPISNPNGLTNQVEGGLIHGMSRALREEVTWSADRVTSIDWRTYYRPWFLGDRGAGR